MMSFSCSGVRVMRSPHSSELRHTDLPCPVAPATSMCGIEARSAMSSLPEASLPNSNGSSIFELAIFQASDSKISRNEMPAGLALGTSMPTSSLPGIGASIRSDFA